MDNTEHHLLDLLKHGNIHAYEQVFSLYYSTLCAYARLYVKSDDVCENIVQELFAWLWERHSEISVTTSLSGYLFTATRNRCLKHLSHEMVEQRMLDVMYQRLRGQFETPDFYVLKELESHIREAISALPETWRQAFEMSRFERKTYNEISKSLGVSPKTVDYRIRQAVKSLRAALKDYLPLVGAFLMLD